MSKDKKKTVGGSFVGQAPAISAGAGQQKKANHYREKYHQKMARLGFKKLQPYVHKDDEKDVLDYAKKKREKRLK